MIFNVEYYHAPPREIDQSIAWLQSMIADCEAKIARLERLKSQKERTRRHRAKFDALARDFTRDDFLDIDPDNQVEIIRQRLGCDYGRARMVRDAAIRRARIIARRARDVKIIKLWEAQIPVTEIANDVQASRVTVHKVIKAHKKNPII